MFRKSLIIFNRSTLLSSVSSVGSQLVSQNNGPQTYIGVQNMHSCGIGGGSFLVIHDPDQGVERFINCRETAPESAFRDMYQG